MMNHKERMFIDWQAGIVSDEKAKEFFERTGEWEDVKQLDRVIEILRNTDDGSVDDTDVIREQ